MWVWPHHYIWKKLGPSHNFVLTNLSSITRTALLVVSPHVFIQILWLAGFKELAHLGKSIIFSQKTCLPALFDRQQISLSLTLGLVTLALPVALCGIRLKVPDFSQESEQRLHFGANQQRFGLRFLNTGTLLNITNRRSFCKMAMSRARTYADVNSHRPREYWDYESHVVEWG